MASEFLSRDFGTRGCLETLVGFDTILRRWQPEARADQPEVARALLQAAQAGEEAAVRAIGDAATLIGMAAANLSLVIDPSLLVLSGPLVGNGGDVLERVRRVVSQVIPRPPKVVCSLLGDGAMLAGSLLVAAQEARGRLRQRLRDPRHAEERSVAARSKGSLDANA